MEAPIPSFKSHSKKFQICGHSNGIVCLSTDDHARVLLYNPLTREFRDLPNDGEWLGVWYSSPSDVAVGMGYDSSINDFKVIRIRETGRMTWAEQYTLGLNTNSWTVMPNSNSELFDFDSDSFALCFNRTFYWWAWYFEGSSFVIVALNMDDDGVFQIVPKPPRACIGEPHDRSLTVWNDSISLVCYNYDFDVDIWVMDGFCSWKPMRTIKHLTKVPKPLVFWKGNELLMEMVSWGEIKSYNVDTKEIKDVLQTDGLISDFQAVNYVASLVQLKGEYL
ncbi:F-box/kelch-repeat protein At3g06240-like [Lotus japonicus]|uniref:F-box/kelch-repeat protein At3g06240-like n=1 Tax=Lotus japonicus TaxID=34305 RepID=UPI0025827C7B|nr:F-box/kelch-repeat protein At3g06240-like [Lotus japonicus]